MSIFFYIASYIMTSHFFGTWAAGLLLAIDLAWLFYNDYKHPQKWEPITLKWERVKTKTEGFYIQERSFEMELIHPHHLLAIIANLVMLAISFF